MEHTEFTNCNQCPNQCPAEAPGCEKGRAGGMQPENQKKAASENSAAGREREHPEKKRGHERGERPDKESCHERGEHPEKKRGYERGERPDKESCHERGEHREQGHGHREGGHGHHPGHGQFHRRGREHGSDRDGSASHSHGLSGSEASRPGPAGNSQ